MPPRADELPDQRDVTAQDPVVNAGRKLTPERRASSGFATTGMIFPNVQDDAEADLRAEVMEDLHSRYSVADGIRMNASIGWLVAERSR